MEVGPAQDQLEVGDLRSTPCDPRTVTVEPDPWWTQLVDVLATVGVVEERDPHGLVVSLRRTGGTSPVVAVVMTPAEWEDLVAISWGSVELAAQHVRELVLAQPPDQGFLVYSCYVLEPCDAPELPADPGFLRLQELAAQHPDGIIPGGGWYAYPHERRWQVVE